MKIKIFLISYLSFLLILFTAISMISIYLTNHQHEVLQEQSIREYQRLESTFTREIELIYSRTQSMSVIEAFVQGQRSFNHIQGIEIDLFLLHLTPEYATPQIITFLVDDGNYFFNLTGQLETTAGYFSFEADFDVTDEMVALRYIQRNLLLLFISFGIVAFIFLYVVMDKIFKPLEIVVNAAQKIATGDYSKRIQVAGKGELKHMADHFNQMAVEIENQFDLLEEETNRKQQFMDSFAHEVRTPLTAIYGYAEYMKRATLTESTKLKSTTYIMNEAKYLKNLAHSMLELATLRDFKLEKESISLGSLYEQIEATLQEELRSQQVDLIIDATNIKLMAHYELLKSLILNLCINAINACVPGDGQVVLSAKLEGEIVQIAVADNGCGIAEEDLLQLAEPFYRVDKSRNRLKGGAGLGMTLATQIVNLHEARMDIQSQIDVGTTVVIYLTTS